MGHLDMPTSFAELMHDWHDFYVLIGTASATLVGLMFVAASIGASVFNEEHRAPMRAFVTPTVVHFAAVLFTSLLVTIPTHSWHGHGALLAAGGLAGAIYCGKILVEIVIRRSFNVDFGDRLFYALIPLLGYLLLLISAALLLMRSAAGAEFIAAALLTLLLAGIRNAWDMTVWIMIRAPSRTEPPEATGSPP
jgi:hypothetical protein